MAETLVSVVPLEIPIFSDAPYTQAVTLDQRTYLFRVIYSNREDCYYMDLLTVSGGVLIRGIKIVTGVNLLHAYRYSTKVPPGVLYAEHQGLDDDMPRYGDLGERVLMKYIPGIPSE